MRPASEKQVAFVESLLGQISDAQGLDYKIRVYDAIKRGLTHEDCTEFIPTLMELKKGKKVSAPVSTWDLDAGEAPF